MNCKVNSTYRWLVRFFLGCVLFVLAGCNQPQPVITPDPIQTSTPLEATASSTPAVSPIPSPTIEVGKVLLWTSPNSDVQLAADLDIMLRPLAEEAGFIWEVRTQITSADLTSQVKLVIALPPFENLATMVPAAPQTQFLTVGGPALPAAGNLSQAGIDTNHSDQQAFIAGVIAAMITDDWRVGVIAFSDTPAGQAASLGFKNGAVYFCGVCRPVYPPFMDKQGGYIRYPISFEIPSGASSEQWQEAAAYLLDRSVKTIYLPPGAPLEVVMDTLATSDIKIISGALYQGDPPPNWVAAVHFNALQPALEIFPNLLGGQSSSLPAAFLIEQTNPELFSPARQHVAYQIMEEVLAGYISTGVETVTEP